LEDHASNDSFDQQFSLFSAHFFVSINKETHGPTTRTTTCPSLEETIAILMVKDAICVVCRAQGSLGTVLGFFVSIPIFVFPNNFTLTI
jgi:hypothetical protein